MTTIDAKGLDFQALNQKIREGGETVVIENCIGQRYLASGMSGKDILINGVPGNALGAYLDGSNVHVIGNAQDATGDTMNDGKIVIEGNAGDATGYAMRGGTILIKGNAGYRTGIHMKQYQEKIPQIVIGEEVGSFLGEYLAGGKIVVLGVHQPADKRIVGNFTGTGMHGGKIYLRSEKAPHDLPPQVCMADATDADKEEIRGLVEQFCSEFGYDADALLQAHFFVLTPNAKNPYHTLYTQN
jgi:glutamate synthase domain-containing protein 3